MADLFDTLKSALGMKKKGGEEGSAQVDMGMEERSLSRWVRKYKDAMEENDKAGMQEARVNIRNSTLSKEKVQAILDSEGLVLSDL